MEWLARVSKYISELDDFEEINTQEVCHRGVECCVYITFVTEISKTHMCHGNHASHAHKTNPQVQQPQRDATLNSFTMKSTPVFEINI